jgi:hypothetical protein
MTARVDVGREVGFLPDLQLKSMNVIYILPGSSPLTRDFYIKDEPLSPEWLYPSLAGL